MRPPAFMRRPLKGWGLGFLAALLVLVAVAGYYLLAPWPAGDPVIVEIPAGAGARQIGTILQRAGVIRQGLAFSWLVRIQGHDLQLQAGEYRMVPGTPLLGVIEQLLRGEVVTHPLTIPEGLTVEQIAGLVGESGLGDRDEFLAAARNAELVRALFPEGTRGREPVEGYLFPDTYRFSRKATEEVMVRTMVNRFAQVFSEERRSRAAELGLTVHQVATLASIIEREARVAQERPIIAGVFHNRLRVGMKLQADPTVLYALGRTAGVVLYRDLEVDSPFNTYRHAGLPPGPIANFGVDALRAALFPTAVPYFYFVARNDGTHAFAETYRQHRANIAKYQR